MDSGIERTLSKFVDNTKLCAGSNVLEGRNAIQKDLDRLERWVCANLGQGNPKHNDRWRDEGIESSL